MAEQSTLLKGAAEILERQAAENQDTNPQELILDDSNKVIFPGFPYTFEAVGEQIIVSIDIFKSGLECKWCGGKKRIKYQCTCVSNGRPGYKYNEEQLKEVSIQISQVAAQGRREIVCQECNNNPSSTERDEVCSSCKGTGAILIIPDSSKSLPVTGVVVSMGLKAKELCKEYRIGDRVLFNMHSGTMIPTKAGLMFKYMDWYAVKLKIGGAEDLAAFDFIIT